MKKHVSLLIALVSMNSAVFAFDPAGPPASSSIGQTIIHVSGYRISRVDCKNEPLSDVLEFIRGMEVPKKHGVVIDSSALEEPKTKTVTVVGNNFSILEAVGIVADQLNAEIQICAGKLRLIPKSQSESPTNE